MSRFCTRSTYWSYFAGSSIVIHGLTAPSANSHQTEVPEVLVEVGDRPSSRRGAVSRRCRRPSKPASSGRTDLSSWANRTPVVGSRAASGRPRRTTHRPSTHRHRSSGKSKQFVWRSTMAQLHTRVAFGHADSASSRLPVWSTSSCERKIHRTSSGSTSEKTSSSHCVRFAGVPVSTITGSDAEDHHGVQVDVQRLAQRSLHLMDHPGVIGDLRRGNRNLRANGWKGHRRWHQRRVGTHRGSFCRPSLSYRCWTIIDGERRRPPRPHTTGVGCIYVKDLSAVDLEVLETMVARSYAALTAGTYTKRAREGGKH